MLISPYNISAKTRRIINSASEAEIDRRIRRSARIHRLLILALVLSLVMLVAALATRQSGWAIFLPGIIMIVFSKQVEADETEADLMKIALNPGVITDIRQSKIRS